MKQLLYISAAGILATASSQAATLTFASLSSSLASNTLAIGGYTIADTELSVTGAASGNDFVYTIVYTGSSYDGDATNDTLSFDVLVQGWAGSVTTNTMLGSETEVSKNGATATIGTTDTAVTVNANGWAVANGTMNAGQTLQFSILNEALTTSTGSYDVSLGNFFGSHATETGNSYGHVAVIGEGSGLYETRWNQTNYEITGFSEGDPLYITSAQITEASANPQRWVTREIDFTMEVTAVPEPSSTALLGLGGLALILRRRK
ncbi:PEP-CTERM sorting domain-containing protein [Rubritalea sp.]|uniref:PEP-CTERM sorting domain-containing protein n=1 Tax=Rubritalea sp. TaxID=2109375 RepID=UPI003EF655CE